MDDIRLLLGDSLEVLPTLEAGSADAVCTDPPAGINFMSKNFDTFRGRDHFIGFLASVMTECLRVLKPGGYAFVWALPRTSHWTATAIEDAGFEVRDRIAHITGQGFPKGKGCLKPAVEDWWLARKPGPKVLPLPGLEECRVGTSKRVPGVLPSGTGLNGYGERSGRRGQKETDDGQNPNIGRWPPNLCLTHLSLPVCRLVDTISPESEETIRRYFHGYSRVQALRQTSQRFPVVLEERTEVLREEVRGRSKAGSAESQTLSVDLSDVQEGVPLPSLLGEERQAEVLRQGLSEPVVERESERLCSSDAREETHCRIKEEDAEESDGASWQGSPVMEGRQVEVPRLHHSLPGGSDPRAVKNCGSHADDKRKRFRAPSGDGNASKTASQARRGSASYEWGQGRQPAGQPGALPPRRTFSETPTGGAGTKSAESREPPLEVLAGDVPEGWRCYFEPTGEDLGCQRIGTKKVRGSHQNGKPWPRNAEKGWSGWEQQEGDEGTGYADADGLETVEDWVCADECPVRLLGEQSGERRPGERPARATSQPGANGTMGNGWSGRNLTGERVVLDGGSAARFFPQFHWSAADDVPFLYQPKAGRSERWFYCRDCEDAFPPEARQEHLHGHHREGKEDWSHLVGHPTQKPLALMSWLVRLVAGPGELVLDPFMGSGTTALACLREGRRFIGIEKDEEYYAISLARLQAEQADTPLFPT